MLSINFIYMLITEEEILKIFFSVILYHAILTNKKIMYTMFIKEKEGILGNILVFLCYGIL